MTLSCDIENPNPADKGVERINWAFDEMPRSTGISERFAAERSLQSYASPAVIPALEKLAVGKHRPRSLVDEYRLQDGRRIRLLAEGRLVNLAAAEGHPATVMDMSFANQASTVEWLAEHGAELSHAVHRIPQTIDRQIAALKLKSMAIDIDVLTPEQRRYLASWREGT